MIFVEGTGRRLSVSGIITSLRYINVATLLRCSLSERRKAAMGLANGLKRWWSDQTAVRSFYALGPEEREALARDTGVSEGTLECIVARGSQAGAELPCILRTLSLDPARIARQHPELLRNMSITCSTCDAVKECRRDLQHGDASRTFKRFCPNAQDIDALENERWERRERLIERAVSQRSSRPRPA